MNSLLRMRRVAAVAAAAALATPTLAIAADGVLAGPQIVRSAACKANEVEHNPGKGGGSTKIDCGKQAALEGFVKAADEMVNPAIVALAAVCPLACIVGGAALMFGNRRGMVIVGSALGALVFTISIKGIVA